VTGDHAERIVLAVIAVIVAATLLVGYWSLEHETVDAHELWHRHHGQAPVSRGS
jgi:hypothetical protein